MTEKTISILKSLKLGEIYPAHKPLGKQEIEEQGILSKLYRLDVLSKTPRGSYKIGNSKLLSKFIELQDLDKLSEYIENISEYEKGNVTNIIQGNNYGNQSSSFSNSPQTTNINANNKPTEKKNLIIRFWKLISENKLVAGILILVILYILKLKFGIDFRNP